MDSRKKHEPIENLEIIKKIWQYLDNNIEFIKVKGHAHNNDWNAFVDKLAVKGKTDNYHSSINCNSNFKNNKEEVIKYFLKTIKKK